MSNLNIDIDRVNYIIIPGIKKIKQNNQKSYNSCVTLRKQLPAEFSKKNTVNKFCNDLDNINKDIEEVNSIVNKKLHEVELIEKRKINNNYFISILADFIREKIGYSNSRKKIKNATGSSSDKFSDNRLITYKEVKKDGYMPQGYTVIGDKTYITAYCKKDKKKKSRVYVYNNVTGEYEGTIILNTNAHVGGVTYDDKNDILFITGKNGKNFTYDHSRLETYWNQCKKINKSGNKVQIDLNDHVLEDCIIKNDIKASNNMATITYHDGAIYSSNFSNKGAINKIEYEYKDGQIYQKSSSIKNCGTATQGMAFYNSGGKDYMILSSSYSQTDSIIYVYEKKGDEYKWFGEKQISHNGLEGIQCDENGNIYGVFEFGNQSIEKIGNINDKDIRGKQASSFLKQIHKIGASDY